MKKLKNKTFIVLLVILTIFLLTLLIIFNSVIYQNTYKQTQEKIMRIESIQDKFLPFNDNNNSNPFFLDMEIYVVSFDNKFNVKKIINYTNDNKTENEIIEIANKYFKNKNASKIGNLYFEKYLFYMNQRNELMIINNNESSERLLYSLQTSIILFILIEIIIIYIAHFLSKWLVKPVEDAFEKQKIFIGDASHELKTPLSIIMASAETIDTDSKNQKWINNIKEESERMNKLVIDLLDLTKSENLKDNEIYEEINLSKLVEMNTLKFESLIYENNLEIDYNIQKDIRYKCSEERIKQLLGILIDNAIKHSLEKSKINLTLYKEKDNIILKVKNRGDEIPKEDITLIFERFYRSDKSRNRNNGRYGLGLAIAKNIVLNHNGNIKVECKNGYTTFIVNLK